MGGREKAVILVSGGLDSTTVLAQAVQQGYACYSLSFDYGQRHRAELMAAQNIDVPEEETTGIPITYVPARNTVFLSIALGWAEVLGARQLFIGVNAVDYSGYPDCRPEFIQAYETMANLATRAGIEGDHLSIQTPLMDLSKGDIIQRGVALGVDYSLTVSCYQADAEGFACGRCDSCRLRRQGFADAGVDDPTRYLDS
jgi:7-cyano-7-deazaguanine synthase